jgi:hypothetical protein
MPSVAPILPSHNTDEDAVSDKRIYDLHDELAELLNYIGTVGTSIRYLGQYSRQEPNVFSDIVWLGDSLHKLHHLGEAIRRRDRYAIASACCWLIADHENYRNDACTKLAFSGNRVNIDEAIGIFEAINAKVA